MDHNIVNATYLALARFEFRSGAHTSTADIWAAYIGMCERDGVTPIGRKSLMYALRRVGMAWGFEPATVRIDSRAVKAISGIRLLGMPMSHAQRNAYYPPCDSLELVVPYSIPDAIPPGLANVIYPGGNLDETGPLLSRVYMRAGVSELRLDLAKQAYADLHTKGYPGPRDALRVACLSPVQEWGQRIASIKLPEKINSFEPLTHV